MNIHQIIFFNKDILYSISFLVFIWVSLKSVYKLESQDPQIVPLPTSVEVPYYKGIKPKIGHKSQGYFNMPSEFPNNQNTVSHWQIEDHSDNFFPIKCAGLYLSSEKSSEFYNHQELHHPLANRDVLILAYDNLYQLISEHIGSSKSVIEAVIKLVVFKRYAEGICTGFNPLSN